MKKLLLVASIIAAMSTFPAYGQDTAVCITTERFEELLPTVTDTYTKYTTTSVNIRNAPNLNSDILDTTLVNTSVDVVVEIENWAMITTEDGYAYMRTDWFSDTEIELPVHKESHLGKFRITHYCNCKKCCGKWAGGATESGRMPEEQLTIAVSKTQIPLGSFVTIDGHTYRADDTGSGIKNNCIDIYVSNHEEALNKGVYYADVYLAR